MLTHHHKPVCLSIISTDLPVWSVVETPATLYQKDTEKFHLLLTAPPLISCEAGNISTNGKCDRSHPQTFADPSQSQSFMGRDFTLPNYHDHAG